MTSYEKAQNGMRFLKAAVYEVLTACGESGVSNAELGRSLGIYLGHVRHEGHVSRTILSLLEAEGVVEQDQKSKRWSLISRSTEAND